MAKKISKRKRIIARDKLKQEKAELLSRITENTLNDIRSRVGFILNHYPDTRNDDMSLVIRYWQIFDRDIVGEQALFSLQDLYKLTRINTVIRARAKIQNEFKLFKATESVRKRRAELDSEERQKQVEEKPETPLISVFCDESGKNQDYIIIGSVWVNDAYRVYKIYEALTDWKKENNIQYEFHFSALTKGKAEATLAFVKRALGESDCLGFKAVIIKRQDVGAISTNEAIYKLHYQLVVQGVEHEIQSRRFELPRELDLTKDKDDPSDKIFLSELRQKLKSECSTFFEQKLKINAVQPEDSKTSVYLQLADLFTGVLSRTLNHEPGEGGAHKDKFAHDVIELLGIDLKEENGNSDFAKIIWIE